MKLTEVASLHRAVEAGKIKKIQFIRTKPFGVVINNSNIGKVYTDFYGRKYQITSSGVRKL